MSTELPVTEQRSGDLWVSPDGEPVWPIHTERERRIVEAVVRVSGGRLRPVSARPGEYRAFAGEEVVGLGDAASGEAVLYAHLTGRRVRQVASFEQLARGPVPDVVVTTPEHLTLAMLDHLYLDRQRQGAPGVVCAPRAQLREQVLHRAAAAHVQGPLLVRRVDFLPEEPYVLDESRGFARHGGRATAEDVRRAVGQGAGVLNVITHCDGLDAYFGNGMILCPIGQPPAGAATAHDPSCWHRGVCARLDSPIAESLQRGSLLSPEILSCRLLTWTSCFSLVEDGGGLAQRWSLLRNLLDVPTIGAILAPASLYFMWDGIQRLYDALAAGVAAGTALDRMNRTAVEAQLRQYHALFGDPRVGLPAASSPEMAPAQALCALVDLIEPGGGAPGAEAARPDDQASPGQEADDVSDEEQPADSNPLAVLAPAARGAIRLYAHLCEDQVRRVVNAGGEKRIHGETYLATARAGRAAIRRYLLAHRDGPRGDEIAQAGAELRQSRVAFLTTCGSPTSNWLKYADCAAASVTVGPCPQCGKQARIYRLPLQVPEMSARRVTVCPRCQFAEDAPLHSDLSFRWNGDRTISLAGTLPRTDWAAAVRCWAHEMINGETMAWPAAASGEPVSDVGLERLLGPGFQTVSFFLAHGADWTMLSTRVAVEVSRHQICTPRKELS